MLYVGAGSAKMRRGSHDSKRHTRSTKWRRDTPFWESERFRTSSKLRHVCVHPSSGSAPESIKFGCSGPGRLGRVGARCRQDQSSPASMRGDLSSPLHEPWVPISGDCPTPVVRSPRSTCSRSLPTLVNLGLTLADVGPKLAGHCQDFVSWLFNVH